jgi:N-hydroxyarylamine O-acetyltransferase
MSDDFDLNAYLRRIGYRKPPAADLRSLCGLAVAHAAALPFENLNPWLGMPVLLSVDALERKLVQGGRGGYCFEQNGLFAAALRAIGFDVQSLIARVLWNQPEDAITAQTHMLLLITLAGESWLVDVGFGAMTLAGTLHLQPDVEQPTALEPFRLLQHGDEWRMQACVRGTWLTLYRFDLQAHPPIDYEVANHYVSTHPQSNFVNHLVAARTASDRRLTLRDREFTVRRLDAEPERRTLRDVAELRHVLESEFLLRLPEGAALDRRLGALPEGD